MNGEEFVLLYTLTITQKRYMKKVLRADMRKRKKDIGKELLMAMSNTVCEKLMQHERYIRASRIMLYAALWDEVNLELVLHDALASGKTVVYPTVVGDDIIPVEIKSDTVWEVGDFGIMEPQAEEYTGGFDTIVVPGVAFDKRGNRLGRGKGYYDRFLSKHEGSYRLGVCFDFQVVEEVPTEDFDYPMHDVVFG